MSRYIPSIVWGLILAIILLIPFKIISYGYLPSDDALRHAAKAVSGKTWSEILILRSAPVSFLPWIAAIRPPDWLILNRSTTRPLDLPQLEWRHRARNTWIWRLPEELRKDN